MKKKIITWSKVVLFFFIIIRGLLHITPHNALRTRLFLEGYPKSAFTTEIRELESGLTTNRVRFYMFYPEIKFRRTGNTKLAY